MQTNINAGLPRSNLHFELYEALAAAESLRLAGRAAEAHGRYSHTAHLSANANHTLERAHAVLGMAECKQLLGQVDHSLCHAALKLYRALDVPWGQTHALVALVLAEPDVGVRLSRLQEAETLAQRWSFSMEVGLIHALSTSQLSSPAHVLHALIFV